MAKKALKRVFRTKKLSPRQIERDQEIRQKIEAEFPPLAIGKNRLVLSDPLKYAISKSAKSVEELAREARISAGLVERFISGEGDLRLASADRLAHVLGLKLVGRK